MKKLVTFLAGCFLPVAFAPFGYWWIAPIVLAVLLWSWITATLKQAFYLGWLFGFGFFAVGVSWVFVSIHRFGGANVGLAGFLTLLLIVVLALFFAIQGWVFVFVANRVRRNLWLMTTILFPVIWVFFEWLRSWIFTGFPWLLLGYSQTGSPLKGFAPMVGCLGISFLVALTAGLMILLASSRDLITTRSIPSSSDLIAGSSTPSFRGLTAESSSEMIMDPAIKSRDDVVFKNNVICIFLMMVIWGGGYFLQYIHWTKPIGQPIKVSLIQGNIPQSIKWDPDQVLPTLTTYQLLTQAHWDSDLIVWPEAAVPVFKSDANDYLNYLSIKAKKHHVGIILGIPIEHEGLIYNAAIAIGNGEGEYDKRRLVPFGEFMPFERYLRGLIQFFNLPMSDFSAGEMNQHLLTVNGIKIAPLICYEVAYSYLLKHDLPEAQLFIVMSDDTWFGNSIAEPQHLQIAQMRALETGRYILVSTNDGITAIIKPDGTLQKTIPQFKAGVLTGEVFAMIGS